ncbi:MAG TPA: TIGR01244 family sulfur transferase [Usitatibacter sp.]|nr:TIGR01244 family sulfur transferase [Usitatibacter sp.]
MSELRLTYVAPDIAVAPQVLPEHMAALAAGGFRSVINNRMENEPGQPAQESLREAASRAGLDYEWQPVNSSMISVQDVQAFAALLERLPRPVLAFCRSGHRSNVLFQAAMQMQRGKAAE